MACEIIQMKWWLVLPWIKDKFHITLNWPISITWLVVHSSVRINQHLQEYESSNDCQTPLWAKATYFVYFLGDTMKAETRQNSIQETKLELRLYLASIRQKYQMLFLSDWSKLVYSQKIKIISKKARAGRAECDTFLQKWKNAVWDFIYYPRAGQTHQHRYSICLIQK